MNERFEVILQDEALEFLEQLDEKAIRAMNRYFSNT